MYPVTVELMVRSVTDLPVLLSFAISLCEPPIAPGVVLLRLTTTPLPMQRRPQCWRSCFLILPCQQILLLGRHEVRAVDGKEWFSLAHVLIGALAKTCECSQEAYLHVGEKTLIDVYRAGRTYARHSVVCIRRWPVSYADALHPLGVSWTGTSGVSIFCSDMDGAGFVRTGRRTRGYRLTSPDIGIFIAVGCLFE